MSNLDAHPLDHLVLPVVDLAVSRARLTTLGFTVAPDGVHPFGTENCCVYFSDNTFLEPLAVRDETIVAEAAAAGNVFVARDRDFRRHSGEEGLSAMVFGTDDAVADDEGFREQDVSAGAMLDFSRAFTDAAGQTGTASFRLAFAAAPRENGIFFFTCQRINAPAADRGSLQVHDNGVTRILRVALCAAKPANHAGILLDASGASDAEGLLSSSVRIHTPNAAIDILSPADMNSEFGVPVPDIPALRAVAIVFGTSNLAGTQTLLHKNDIGFATVGNRLVVSPAPGQGALFVFEEAP